MKLIALEFVNNFLSLFYIAFWLRDINLIRSQLMTQLIVFQVFIPNERDMLSCLFYFILQIVQKLQGTLYPIVVSKLIVLKDNVLSSWYQVT